MYFHTSNHGSSKPEVWIDAVKELHERLRWLSHSRSRGEPQSLGHPCGNGRRDWHEPFWETIPRSHFWCWYCRAGLPSLWNLYCGRVQNCSQELLVVEAVALSSHENLFSTVLAYCNVRLLMLVAKYVAVVSSVAWGRGALFGDETLFSRGLRIVMFGSSCWPAMVKTVVSFWNAGNRRQLTSDLWFVQLPVICL